MKKLVIIGAGGHALEVVWLVERLNLAEQRFALVGFCSDSAEEKGREKFGLRVLGAIEEVAATLSGQIFYFCAIGGNDRRAALSKRADSIGWQAVSLVDPSVILSPRAQVGTGVYIGAGSLVSSNATIEDFVIVNYHCTVGHDVVLKRFSQVASGCHVLGGVILGEFAFMGASSVILPQKKLGAHATLAAGAVAVKDIPAGCTAIGNPAQIIFEEKQAK